VAAALLLPGLEHLETLERAAQGCLVQTIGADSEDNLELLAGGIPGQSIPTVALASLMLLLTMICSMDTIHRYEAICEQRLH
jgi:hypothetical protein